MISNDLPSLADFLAEPIARRALLACLMIGFANGFVSAFVVLRKSALKIGTLSHALLPGIALAVLLVGLTQWSALAGAVFAALLVGLGSIFCHALRGSIKIPPWVFSTPQLLPVVI